MSTRDERPKASDVFRESHSLFAKKVGFEEAFPAIADIAIDVEISELGAPESQKQRRTYGKANTSEYVDCINPLCYNGGISLGSIIRQMVLEKQTALEVTKKCQGYEGSKGGRRKYRDCFTVFRVRVLITYRPEQAQDELGPTHEA